MKIKIVKLTGLYGDRSVTMDKIILPSGHAIIISWPQNNFCSNFHALIVYMDKIEFILFYFNIEMNDIQGIEHRAAFVQKALFFCFFEAQQSKHALLTLPLLWK